MAPCSHVRTQSVVTPSHAYALAVAFRMIDTAKEEMRGVLALDAEQEGLVRGRVVFEPGAVPVYFSFEPLTAAVWTREKLQGIPAEFLSDGFVQWFVRDDLSRATDDDSTRQQPPYTAEELADVSRYRE